MRILVLPTIHRTPSNLDHRLKGGGAPLYVYGGEEIGGLDTLHVTPRWLLRKLAVIARLRAPSAWDSAALVAFTPAGCLKPAIAWGRLTPPAA